MLPSQLLDPKELMGSSGGCSGQLRSLAFSVYTRCRPQAEISIDGARSMTTFGPVADRLKHDQVYNEGRVWQVFILHGGKRLYVLIIPYIHCKYPYL